LSAETGAEVAVVKVEKSAHNTIFSPAGGEVFLADRHSKKLRVLDASTNKISRTVGPFSNFVRPFTVDGSARRVYVCCDDRLGFEIGDLKTGAVVDVIDVEGFTRGPVARHSCPCHGIGMTPDETEIWLCDSFNRRLHVFDLTASRPRLKQSVEVRDEPGWITFGLDGKFAYPSTGEVIDAATKKIVAKLVDEKERAVHGEKLLEIDVVTKGGETSFVFGDQFGVGRKPVSRERIDLTPRVSAPRLSDQRQRGDARDEADRR
jgi:DNA-binding beta-propeller fold protein YncE